MPHFPLNLLVNYLGYLFLNSLIKEGHQTHCLLFWLLEDPQALHQSTSPDLLESCLARTMDFEGTTLGLLEDQIGRYQLLRIYYLFFSFGIFTFIY